MTTEDLLVEYVSTHDEACATELVQRVAPILLKSVQRRFPDLEVEDAVQDTLVLLCSQRTRLTNVIGWCRTCACRLVLRTLRRRRPERLTDDVATFDEPIDPTAAIITSLLENPAQIREFECYKKAKHDIRQIIDGVFIDHQSIHEVSCLTHHHKRLIRRVLRGWYQNLLNELDRKSLLD